MIRKDLIFPLLLCLFCFVNLSAQELSEEEQELLSEYWNNGNFVKGLVLAESGKYLQSRSFFIKASKEFEEEKNWEAYISSQRNIVFTYPGSEDYQDGVDLGEATLKKIEQEAPEFLKFCDDIYHSIGSIYDAAFQPEHSLQITQRQLTLLKEQYDLDSSWRFGRAYDNLGIINMNLENWEEALSFFLKAKNVLSKDTEDEEGYRIGYLANTYQNLGNIYEIRGNYDQAIKNAKKAIELMIECCADENDLLLVPSYEQIAHHYANQQEYELSLNYYKKAAFIINQSGATDEMNHFYYLPEIYNSIGNNYLSLGDSKKAYSYFTKTVQVLEAQTEFSPYIIAAYTGISRIHLQKNELDSALNVLLYADSLFFANRDATDNNIHFNEQIKQIEHGLATVWIQKGEIAKAKNIYHHLIKASSEKESEWSGDAQTYMSLANLLKQEHQDSFLYYNQKALIQVCTNFNPKNSTELPQLEQLKNLIEVYAILTQRSNYLMGLASVEQSQAFKVKYWKDAQAVINLIDQFHAQSLSKINLLRGGKSRKLIEHSIDPYKKGLLINNDHHQLKPSRDLLEKQFYYAQKMKAQQLWLSLLNSEASDFGHLPTSVLEKERDLLADIQYFEKKVLEAHQNKDTRAIQLYENQYLFESQKAYIELVEDMELNYPSYYELKYAFKPETEASLQKLLSEKEVLIEYVLMDASIFIFTLSKNQALQVKKIALNEQTNQQIRTLNDKLKNSVLMRKSSREKFIKLNHALYKQFIAPIEQEIKGKERLIIIGDDLTNYIPFEVLLRSDEIANFKDLDYLIKAYEISYHYSSNLFAKARQKKGNQHSAIFAFAPIYEKNAGTTQDNATVKSRYRTATFRTIDKSGHLYPLPESEKEVNTIIDLFAKNGLKGNMSVLRQKANESVLKSQLEKPYQFIHIAGHSYADLENPKFSGIACFQDSNDKIEDGTLYVGEIYNINIEADLVTLSSCESGYGKLETAEGLLGLNRAFIYAGTPNVVFSLWKVYDKVSAHLMIDFYTHILSGKTYAASLRAAKLNLLNQEETAAPHFWSPYLLIGK